MRIPLSGKYSNFKAPTGSISFKLFAIQFVFAIQELRDGGWLH